MAALQDDAVLHFDDQNNVGIQLVDEEDFPLASIPEHQASDEEFYSDASEIRAKSWNRRTTKWNQLKKIGLEEADAQ